MLLIASLLFYLSGGLIGKARKNRHAGPQRFFRRLRDKSTGSLLNFNLRASTGISPGPSQAMPSKFRPQPVKDL
jgi:hypothetical protein